MRALGVVPDQPVNQLLVEGTDVVTQKRPIEHDEVIGDRPIESLDERVLFRASWVSVEVCEAERGAG